MSLKATTFANIITHPLNIHNFLVQIPEADLSVIVNSSSFPTEKLRKVVLWFQGEQIRYPGLPENSGEWKVKIAENDDGRVKKQFDALKSQFYNQKTGLLTPKRWTNVQVTARDLAQNLVFAVILHGVWLQGRDEVQLANNDPSKNWEWDYTFNYTWIEDIDFNNRATTPPM